MDDKPKNAGLVAHPDFKEFRDSMVEQAVRAGYSFRGASEAEVTAWAVDQFEKMLRKHGELHAPKPDKPNIEWADKSFNPLAGAEAVPVGSAGCYAETTRSGVSIRDVFSEADIKACAEAAYDDMLRDRDEKSAN